MDGAQHLLVHSSHPNPCPDFLPSLICNIKINLQYYPQDKGKSAPQVIYLMECQTQTRAEKPSDSILSVDLDTEAQRGGVLVHVPAWFLRLGEKFAIKPFTE